MAIINGDEFGNNLFGTNEDDQLFGFGGFDLLFGSLGNDTLDGGTDTDVAIYDVGLFTNGVFINNTDTAIGTVLANTVDKRGFGTDTLIDVSAFHGTEFDDAIYLGPAGGTYTFDKAGDDLVVASQDPNASDDHYFGAGSGNDTLIGTVNRDRVDYSNDFDILGAPTQGVNVDLQTGVATDGWGFTDQLTSIERVTGTNFDDTLLGNDDRNDFSGLQGNDLLDGRGGDRDRAEYGQDPSAVFVDLAAGTATDGWGDTDTLIGIEQVRGSEFNDTLLGSEDRDGFEGEGGDDFIQTFGGNDFLEGDGGTDTLDGGEGRDAVGFFDDPAGVVVDLGAGTAIDGWGNSEVLISIEEADGSRFDDTLRGDDGDNFLDGREGNDLLEGLGGDFDNFRGSAGNDTIDGGDGRDRAEYHRDADRGGSSGVVVDLVAGTATDGFGDTDTLISIEDVRGTQFDDLITGNDDRNEFELGQGNDIVDGGAAFVEFNGGDRVRYNREHEDGGFQGINVDLAAETATDTFGDTDTLISIEEIEGSIFDDTILGSGADEELRGGYGNDFINAVGGLDNGLSGGAGDDTLIGSDTGGDFFRPGSGADVIEGNGDSPTGLTDHLQYGGEDNPSQGIVVTFSNEKDGTVVDFAGDIDTFTGIEIVEGSRGDDLFVGAEGEQEFRGLEGNDTFDGGAGDRDRINYRFGNEENAVQGVEVNLTTGVALGRFGDTDTILNIESVQGSISNDTLIGNTERNELDGREGDDLIDSVGGQDNFLGGGRGNDTLEARGDSDFANGGDGNDLITFYGVGGGANPGLGSDTIIGGTDGFFDINYGGVGADLIIDTATGTTQILGTTDVDAFSNIRNLEGGEGNDTLLGDDNEEFQRFRTSIGDDFIDGRGGFDMIEYDDDRETSVIIDFTQGAADGSYTGTVTGSYAGTDRFINIEEARGSDGNDTFIGDASDNRFRGMDGEDSFDGGDGFDSVSYSSDRFNGGGGPVDVDLFEGTATDGWGKTDTLVSIERIVATDLNDTLVGSSGDDRLIGILGADSLNGGAGNDGLYAGGDADTVTGGEGQDSFGGQVEELDGDIFTDFSDEDVLQVFDENFQRLAAEATIVGNEMRIDADGDGIIDATVTLTNGFTGPVTVDDGEDPEPEATVFSVDDAGLFTSVVAEDGVADVTVRRTGDVSSTASVEVTLTGSGLNPVDGTDISVPFETPITLNFAPDQEEITYQIGIVDDFDVESFEDLAFTLSNPVSDGAGGAEISGSQTFVRILDNDVAPSVRIDGEKRNEDAGEISFTVSRTGDTSQSITVPYEITSAGGLQGAEADDLVGGLPQSGSVVIEAGESETTFTIAVAPDTVAELHDDIIATIGVGPDWPTDLEVDIAQATSSIRNDDGVPPVLPVGATGSNYGDPHIVTLDGLAYDFQAVGEFTLIEAASGDPLNVQVRFQPVDGSEVASQTTAVATTLGAARLVIDVDGSSLVSVDGATFDLNSAVGGASVGDGEIYYDGEAITLVYANGEQLRVDLFDGFLSTSVSIAAGRDVRGLLGNADGDASNDLALRDGTVLAQPVSFADLYGIYADNWRIADATSLFDYATGQGTADFTDTSFPAAGVTLDDFPIEVIAAAEALAKGITDPALKNAAILDYLVTGNADYVEAAQNVDDAQSAPVVETEPTAAPDIPSGIGIAVSDAEITEGDSGSQAVTFTIYRTGDVSNALDVNYSVGGDIDSGDVAGALSGSVSFASGEASREITLDVLGDTTVEANESLNMSFAVAGGDAPVVLSSTARTVIVNDDLTPDEPELNLIEGTSKSNVLVGTSGADLIISDGGRIDLLYGGADADVFVFGDETFDRKRDRDVIFDYEVGLDSILLSEGAEVASVRDTWFGVRVSFEGGRDKLFIYGDGVDADNITIEYDLA